MSKKEMSCKASKEPVGMKPGKLAKEKKIMTAMKAKGKKK